MKRGHVTGGKRERKPRQATIDRYQALGAAIAAPWAGKTVDQLLTMPAWQSSPGPALRKSA
jgi:hypothetical protein